MIVRHAAGLALAIVIMYLAIFVVLPDSSVALRFLAYVVGFNLLPGLAALMLAAPGRFTPGVLLFLSGMVGLVLNMLAVTILWLCGATWLLASLPVLAGAVLVLVCLRSPLAPPRIGALAVTTAFLGLTPIWSLAHILAGDPGDSFSSHSAFQAVLVRGLQQGWPPVNLMLPDVPLAYNYLAHLWVLGATAMTGLPLDLLVARLAPLFLGGTAAASLLVAGRLMLGLRWWIAALPVVCVFWVPGLAPIGAGVFGTLMPFGAHLILSPYPAMVLFICTLLLLMSDRPANGPLRFLALATLAFLATGARGVAPPIMICALALHLILTWCATRRLSYRDLGDMIALLLGFAGGLLLFFQVLSEFTGVTFVKFNGHPFNFLVRADQHLLTLPHTLIDRGMPPLLTAGLAFLVIALFHGGFLAPALPAAFASCDQRERKALTLLAGGSIAGISAFFMTEAPGYSHVSFLYYSGACMALLGAAGLQRLIQEPRRGLLKFVLLAVVLVLAGVRASEFPGPALKWLWGRVSNLAGDAMKGTLGNVPPVVTCTHPTDAALFAGLHGTPGAVVVLLRRKPVTAHCEQLWLLVETPIQAITQYALENVPGTGSSELTTLLAERNRIMNAAIASATEGHLAVRPLMDLRHSLGPTRPLYVMADEDLAPDAPDQIQLEGSSDRSKLWRVGN